MYRNLITQEKKYSKRKAALLAENIYIYIIHLISERKLGHAVVNGNQSEVKILTYKDGLITSNRFVLKQMVGLAGSVVSWMTRSRRYLVWRVMS